MRFSNRVHRLEKTRQQQQEGKPYTVVEGVVRQQATPQGGIALDLGFVKARITPRGGNPASVVITYDGRFLTTEEALAAIESRLPPSRSVYLFPDTTNVQDWTEKFSESLSTIQQQKVKGVFSYGKFHPPKRIKSRRESVSR